MKGFSIVNIDFEDAERRASVIGGKKLLSWVAIRRTTCSSCKEEKITKEIRKE